MFVRLTSLSIALVAMAGAIAVANGADAPWCPTDRYDVCCKSGVAITPKGYQGSNCKLVKDLPSGEKCPSKHELCCNKYDANGRVASVCRQPRSLS